MNDELVNTEASRSAKDRARSVREFYEKHGHSFARTRGFVWNEEKLIAERIHPGMTVVDVGAGNGRFATLLTNIEYIGIEPSSTLRASADPTLNLQPGELPNLSLNDRVADIVVSFAVFHHLSTFEERRLSVNELIRITKSGGLIAASAWYVQNQTPGQDLLIPWKAEGASAERYIHLFADDEWKALWNHPELIIEHIGLFGREDWTDDSNVARNWFVIAHRK